MQTKQKAQDHARKAHARVLTLNKETGHESIVEDTER